MHYSIVFIPEAGKRIKDIRFIKSELSGITIGFNNLSIHSLGFVAIATMIFGKWNPWGVLGAGILFGFAQTLGYYSNSIAFLKFIPTEFFNAFPYILTIIVIVLNGKQVGPKASGELYDPSKR